MMVKKLFFMDFRKSLENRDFQYYGKVEEAYSMSGFAVVGNRLLTKQALHLSNSCESAKL